jgi:hypothetical protein
VTYILAFQAPAGSAGRFHELKVRLLDVPGARATHRAGYYEASPIATAIDRTLSAGEIVMNRLPVEDIRVQALASSFPQADGKSDVPVILEIDGPTLLRGEKGKSAGLEVLIYAFDGDDVIRDFVMQRVSFDLDKLRDKITRRGVKFYHTLRLDPGRYSIRTLVRAANGRSGFRAVAVDVRAARAFSVSVPLLIDESGEWVLVKAPDRTGAGAYPFALGDQTFIPAVAPRLSRDKKYDVALLTHNLPAGDVDLRALASDPSGVTHTLGITLVGRTPLTPAGRCALVVKIDPASLGAGRYSLRMTLGSESVQLPIEVR